LGVLPGGVVRGDGVKVRREGVPAFPRASQVIRDLVADALARQLGLLNPYLIGLVGCQLLLARVDARFGRASRLVHLCVSPKRDQILRIGQHQLETARRSLVDKRVLVDRRRPFEVG
jgi:hypothetical protein